MQTHWIEVSFYHKLDKRWRFDFVEDSSAENPADMLTKTVISWGFTLPQLAFKKIDDEGTTLGGNINQTPSGRIVSIMVLDLVPHRLELWDVVLYFTI